MQCFPVCRDQTLQQPKMFFKHQVTCFPPVVTSFRCMCERMNCSNRICTHRVVFPSVTGNCTVQHTLIVWVLWTQPHPCWKFLKGYRLFLPLQSLCKSHTWQTTACWVLTSIRWSNHMWLTHRWSRINDCHLWLAFIFCGAIGGSWVVMSALTTRPILPALTGDWPHASLFIATHVHNRVGIC